MAIVLIHYVEMEKYEVPDKVAKIGNLAIEKYIYTHDLEPIKKDSRDWEVVDVEY